MRGQVSNHACVGCFAAFSHQCSAKWRRVNPAIFAPKS